jgi:hypothetical protein
MGAFDNDGGEDSSLGGPWLLRPKVEVEWSAPTGDAFPTEDVKEQVVFGSFFERGFNIPAGDFF